MKQWFKKLELQLKKNAFFFMSLITGAIVWSTFTSSEDELAIKFNFLFGVCVSWVAVSLFGVTNGSEDSHKKKTG